MATTQIKRLCQQGTDFVPITLSEAVVVNTDNLDLLNGYGITTLDKVLKSTLSTVKNSALDIDYLNSAVSTINNLLKNKQDKLTAGTGIDITDGVISVTFDSNINLYKIVFELPDASVDCLNTIYLVPSNSTTAGNVYTEYICYKKDENYWWEQIGTISTTVDLSGYVTKEEYLNKINSIEASSITAFDVTLSNGLDKVVVNYPIPDDLYDSIINSNI